LTFKKFAQNTLIIFNALVDSRTVVRTLSSKFQLNTFTRKKVIVVFVNPVCEPWKFLAFSKFCEPIVNPGPLDPSPWTFQDTPSWRKHFNTHGQKVKKVIFPNVIAFKNEFTTENYTPVPTQSPNRWQQAAVVETNS